MKQTAYFAFGSNMLTHRLSARVGSARLIGPVRASGWRLAFHKRGADGSGKCDLCPSHERDSVMGVLFELDETALRILDGFEGPGYQREPIRLSDAGTSIDALAYRAQTAYQDASLQPYGWYRQLVLAGLLEHGASSNEIAKIRRTPWIADPDPERPARLQALTALEAFCAHHPSAGQQLPEDERGSRAMPGAPTRRSAA